ncbi:MAG: Ig-like domain-containing protein [Gemmatimonadaceae bacterium]
MNVPRACAFITRVGLTSLLSTLGIASALPAQQTAAPPAVAKLVAVPARLTMQAGDSVAFKIIAYDARGQVVADPQVRVGGPRRSVAFGDGYVKAFEAGTFNATAAAVGAAGAAPVTLEIPMTVTWPALSKLEITPAPGRLYTRITLAHNAKGYFASGMERKNLTVDWKSSNPDVAKVDRFGNVTGIKPGAVTITAESNGARAEKKYTVAANPVTRLDLGIKESSVRTGDVVHLVGTAKRADGSAVADAPITWSYTYTPNDSIAAPGGPGIIDDLNGQYMFAGNYPGHYTILAQSGGSTAQTVIDVTPRDVRRRIKVTGRGQVTTSHTSDLWPWTGKDGRDYVLVGTWGGDGWALVFDITDMANIVKTDSIKVDARTINDVTVSPDGRYGALSREGASNRVNGVVILDLAVPAHPKIASTFDQELTGGVHNMFATNDNLFAVSGGAKYVIIDVKDIYKPKYVSEYRHPNARLHDLWVANGIAYSAQGGAGTVVVDVGNGKYGGTIEKPKLITVFPVNSGHEIYPYFQKSTGKTYLFIGDEEMNRAGRAWEGTDYGSTLALGGGVAQTSGGYTHIVDFTDPMHPKQVARYHLEDYGSHDIIVQDDVLYQAYYDGGVRLVDVSGELLGNLHDQNREIAVFKPFDPKAFTANASFVMNAMPWKGYTLFTDFNSGLWAAKLDPKTPVVP